MNWLIKIMKEDYGTRQWNKLPREHQMAAVAEFLHNYFNAIIFLKNNKPNE